MANVWANLRPVTKRMVVGAMQKNQNPVFSPSGATVNQQSFYFDAHADWELSRLLTALDARASEAEVRANRRNYSELNKMADACAEVLGQQTESAEVFIQLVTRALRRADFERVDQLADALIDRFSVGEICEIVRQAEHAAVRALAMEALALVPTVQLLPALDDPLYSDIARQTLETQAVEYNSEEARALLEDLANERYFN